MVILIWLQELDIRLGLHGNSSFSARGGGSFTLRSTPYRFAVTTRRNPERSIRASGFSIKHFAARGWGSERISPEERGPVDDLLRRKAETDRVREGISEGCRSAKPERVAPRDVGAVEPWPRATKSHRE